LFVHFTTDAITELQAWLTDAAGKPVPPAEGAAEDIMSTTSPYTLPAGSQMDWRISFDYGISTTAPKADEYRIQVGSGIWNIPKDKAGSYSLQIKLHGWPRILTERMQSMPKYLAASKRVLFDLPAQKIVITPPSAD
jgi:hypothetical protein